MYCITLASIATVHFVNNNDTWNVTLKAKFTLVSIFPDSSRMWKLQITALDSLYRRLHADSRHGAACLTFNIWPYKWVCTSEQGMVFFHNLESLTGHTISLLIYKLAFSKSRVSFLSKEWMRRLAMSLKSPYVQQTNFIPTHLIP